MVTSQKLIGTRVTSKQKRGLAHENHRQPKQKIYKQNKKYTRQNTQPTPKTIWHRITRYEERKRYENQTSHKRRPNHSYGFRSQLKSRNTKGINVNENLRFCFEVLHSISTMASQVLNNNKEVKLKRLLNHFVFNSIITLQKGIKRMVNLKKKM